MHEGVPKRRSYGSRYRKGVFVALYVNYERGLTIFIVKLDQVKRVVIFFSSIFTLPTKSSTL